ncbi:MAG: hypothetical protein Q8Q85_04285 [Gemmatimonadales bacterium]|nr:hypothetical protein [Gemmatimonadales bacterium]
MIDTVTSPGVQVLDLFGPVLLVIGLGVVAFLVLEVLHVVALSLWLAAQGRRTRPRGVLLAALCLAAVVPGLGSPPLAAQVAGAQAAAAQPQPRFTRIFGSDSMQITNPALSPDGRWIVFNSGGEGGVYLWVVPAGGGAPIQLTSGRHDDWFPRWFPSGDRIAFASNRPSPPGEETTRYVMTIPFDARTGRSAGPAQQVSLESGYFPAVSPDGRWILFEAFGLPGTRRLMVVPSTGGTARTVVPSKSYGGRPEWSPDGRAIYFVDRVSGGPERTLMRVSADSGQPQRLWSTPRGMRALNTTARQALTLSDVSLPGSPVAQVFTFEGRPVASVPLHRNMDPSSFTGDGRSVLAVVSDRVAPIRVLPVAGGPSRTLTEAREYDELDTWTADAGRLAVRTRMNGHATLLDIPIDGGQAAEIATPPEATRTMLSPDRNHLFYVVTDSATSRKSLRVRRLSDGRTREIARDLVDPTGVPITGPGGSPFSGAEILYAERRGDRFELRACAPEGEPHVLRSFPASFADNRSFGGVGVQGERVAWTDVLGDSSALLVAEGRNGAPRRVATMRGSLYQPVWSPDGRWIAASYGAPGTSLRYAVLVVGVTPGGLPSAPPRLVEAGLVVGWDIKWLPDSRAVTVFGMSGQGSTPGVWLVSLREGDQPVKLTRDDPSAMWSYSLSPDGRYIAYPAEIPRGSSIWRLDLGEVLAEGRRGTRR